MSRKELHGVEQLHQGKDGCAANPPTEGVSQEHLNYWTQIRTKDRKCRAEETWVEGIWDATFSEYHSDILMYNFAGMCFMAIKTNY